MLGEGRKKYVFSFNCIKFPFIWIFVCLPLWLWSFNVELNTSTSVFYKGKWSATDLGFLKNLNFSTPVHYSLFENCAMFFSELKNCSILLIKKTHWYVCVCILTATFTAAFTFWQHLSPTMLSESQDCFNISRHYSILVNISRCIA